MFLVMCVITKFGGAPRLSPNGTFFSRFQKCNSSFRISPLHTAVLRCRGPSSEDLPRSADSCGHYKVFLHDDYVRIVSYLVYVKVLLHVITHLHCTHSTQNEFHAKVMQRIKEVLSRPNICYPDASYFKVLDEFVLSSILHSALKLVKLKFQYISIQHHHQIIHGVS